MTDIYEEATVPVKRPGRKPQDRKPKAQPAAEDGRQLVTVRGAEYSVDPSALDDFEVLEALQENNIFPALKELLGPDELARAKESVRSDGGRVTFTAMAEWFADLAAAINPNS